jgi:glycosyltransferase involved in cell wall biosynthesis/SAM-dependent methyltransferase
MYDKGDFIAAMEAESGLPIQDLGMKVPGGSRLSNALRSARGLLRFYHLCRHERIDVLQTFTHFSNIIGPIVGRIAGVPVCVASQRNVLERLSRWVLWLDRIVTNSSLVDTMTTVTEETRRYCVEREGIRATKLLTVYNGIESASCGGGAGASDARESRAALGLPPEAFVVTTVARLHEQKGHTYLIEAIPKVISRCSHVHFLIVGDGELKADLVQQATSAGVQNHVHFLGARNDVPQLLQLSDAFALPSVWEGMPNALLEAMALGVPVIATRLKGVEEVVSDASLGILVAPRDAEALATAVLQLVENPTLRQNLADASRAHIRATFCFEKAAEVYDSLYRRLLSAKMPAALLRERKDSDQHCHGDGEKRNSHLSSTCSLCGKVAEEDDRLFFGGTVSLRRCERCTFVEQPQGDDSPATEYESRYSLDFLSKGQTYRYPGAHSGLEDIAQRMVRLMSRGAVLDVGCGDGHFLAVCAQAGFTSHGIEPCKALADYASGVSKVKVKAAYYEPEAFEAGRFDFVSFIQVLEHIRQPLTALRTAYAHLRPGGYIIVEVPSINAPHFLMYRLTGIKAFVSGPTGVIAPHVNYFSPKTLRYAAEQAGFRTLQLTTGRWRVRHLPPWSSLGSIVDPLMNVTRIGGILYIGKKS